MEADEELESKIERIGADIMNRKISTKKVFQRRWRAHFGSSKKVIGIVWTMVDVTQVTHLNHLLWVLLFLKIYPKENVACSMVGGIDEKTWRKKIWPLIESIAQLEDRVVSEYVCLIKNVILFFLTSILDSIQQSIQR